jgi:hypothetical protein
MSLTRARQNRIFNKRRKNFYNYVTRARDNVDNLKNPFTHRLLGTSINSNRAFWRRISPEQHLECHRVRLQTPADQGCCEGATHRIALIAERADDQLWAEAIVRFNADEKWFLETPELEALAAAEQAARFKSDVWKEPIKKWLGKRKDTSVTDVLQHALGLTLREQNRSAQMRVADILTELGFSKKRARKGDKRANRYWR